MNTARELDPLSLFMNTRLGLAFCMARRFDEAKAILKTALDVDPTFSQAHYFLSVVYASEGDYDAALEELPEGSYRPWAAIIHAFKGDTEEAQKIMDDALERAGGGYDWPSVQASLHFASGDIDEGFEWLERALEERDPRLPNTMRSPMSDPWRDDPRFASILERMGLEP
jgi:tetratricopeptide (TPR) repeat protein